MNLDLYHHRRTQDGVSGASGQTRTTRGGRHQITTLTPLPKVWVIANYKETQLTHMAIGQKAEITVDTFPGHTLHGHWTRSRPPRARNSRCCRPTTRPATSPRSCSASRSKSPSTMRTGSPIVWCRACRWRRGSMPGTVRPNEPARPRIAAGVAHRAADPAASIPWVGLWRYSWARSYPP